MRLTTIQKCCGLWLALAMPLGASEVRIYVTNTAGDTVSVIDPITNKVVQVIEGIEMPHGVSPSPDGSRVYVSNESENVVDVVDRVTGKIIKKVPTSDHPHNLAISKDGKLILVCIRDGAGGLDVIDTNTLERTMTIPTGGGMHNVYVTPDGKFAVAGSTVKNFAIVVDLRTLQPVWKVGFDRGVRPMTFDVNPDGSTRRIYVNLTAFHGFAVVDFAKHEEVARVKLPDEPTGGIFRAADISHGIGVAPDNKTLWVASMPANSVFMYSLPDLKLLGHVPVGGVPDWLNFSPDGERVYVANAGSASVTVIDTKSLKEVARIPVGEVPKVINALVLR